MKTFELTGTLRSEYGKKAAKALRKQDLVPCNLYGMGDNITFTVTTSDVRKLIYTPDTMVVALTVGDVTKMAVVKEMQFHPISGNCLHIDFLEVNDKKPVTVEIPISLTGHAEGVKAGGKLSLEMRKLKVNGLYTDIPERVVVDVTALGLGKKLFVSDVTVDKCTLKSVKEAIVAQVKATRNSSAEAASEAAE
ncbi:MAG: 50S ribosomal protein L25/general stress protein Ctc [Paludibacteraceae bacterium]|nr:50S ribosomal protein L25/general stress protein Ctc [Paludibacteraceae bacterium]